MKKKFIQETTSFHTTPDGNTYGVTSKKLLVHKTEDEPFYMTFLKYVGWIYGLSGVSQIKILNKLMEKAQFNTGIVSLTTGEKWEIIDELGISEVGYYKSMKQMIDSDILRKAYRVDKKTGEQIEKKGEYIINPDMFWKGELNKRKELKVTFESQIIEDDK